LNDTMAATLHNVLMEAISRKPRCGFASLPTPIEEAPRLSRRLGVRVLIKRDDMTGLALGGNKVRKLEFLIADALQQKADTVITTGGSQSNHARLAAAACRLTGLECHLVLDRGVHPEPQGNLLLDEMFGAHVAMLESDDPAAATAEMNRVAGTLRAEGKKPYIIPRGGSVPAGATGYVAFVPELLAQIKERDIHATHIYLGTGSTGTHSGVIAGLTAMDSSIRLQGISVSRKAEDQVARIVPLANATLEHLGLEQRVHPEQVRVDDRFSGPKYGVPTQETFDAIHTLALDEATVLDPVYTGKAMAGLIRHAREGILGPSDTVIFIHTGGAPALFAYNSEVSASLSAQ
jgi:D-cysteine desulfhydrase family pyridoxal phosphate-dependent enzyme